MLERDLTYHPNTLKLGSVGHTQKDNGQGCTPQYVALTCETGIIVSRNCFHQRRHCLKAPFGSDCSVQRAQALVCI